MKTLYVFLQNGLLILVLLTLGACHKAVDPSYPDERGELLTNLNVASSNFSGFINWSADGTELYYLATGSAGYQIQAIHVQSRAVRLVAQDNRWNRAPFGGLPTNGAMLSADGQFIYLVAQQAQRSAVPYPHYLYRIDTRRPNQIVVDSIGPNVYSLSAASSPDGRRLALQYQYDSVRVHQLDANTSIRLSGKRPVVFSPDGSRLLLEQGNVNVCQIVSLTDLSTSLTDVRPPTAGPSFSRGNLQWHTECIRYVYNDFNPSKTNPSTFGLFLWNVTQQTSTLLRPHLQEEFPVQSSSVVWSRDGRQIAFSTVNLSQSFEGSRNHILYTTNLTTLTTTKVATITLGDDEKTLNLSPLLISPDNQKMAYAIGSTVYLLSI